MNINDYGKHIAVSVTNACPIKCAHCISGSSPHTNAGDERLEDALSSWLAASPNVKHVTLTGGEPFYDLERLAAFVTICGSHHVRCGAITSAYWAKSHESATDTLKHVGMLESLTISTDVYHQKFVPLRFIRNAYLASKARGIRTSVRFTSSAIIDEHERELRAGIMDFCNIDDIESANLVSYGRATDLNFAAISAPKKNRKYGTCPSSGAHMFHNGDVIPCCNSIVSLRGKHPLHFGNAIDNLSGATTNAFTNMHFLAIKALGFDWLLSKLIAIDSQFEQYNPQNACKFCFDMCSDQVVQRGVNRVLNDLDNRLHILLIGYTQFGYRELLPAIAATSRQKLQSRD